MSDSNSTKINDEVVNILNGRDIARLEIILIDTLPLLQREAYLEVKPFKNENFKEPAVCLGT